MMMNWNEEKRICVCVYRRQERERESSKTAGREKGRKRNMTNDQSERIIAAGFASSSSFFRDAN